MGIETLPLLVKQVQWVVVYVAVWFVAYFEELDRKGQVLYALVVFFLFVGRDHLTRMVCWTCSDHDV